MSEEELCIYYTAQTYVFPDRVCTGNTEIATALRIRLQLRLNNRSAYLTVVNAKYISQLYRYKVCNF